MIHLIKKYFSERLKYPFVPVFNIAPSIYNLLIQASTPQKINFDSKYEFIRINSTGIIFATFNEYFNIAAIATGDVNYKSSIFSISGVPGIIYKIPNGVSDITVSSVINNTRCFVEFW